MRLDSWGRTSLTIALLLSAGLAPSASAQGTDAQPGTPPIVFLEKAYVSLGTPTKKHLLFEGQPTVHYFLYNGLSNEGWQKKLRGFAWATPVTANLLVRMTRDGVPLQNGEVSTSEPVFTPSYRIGIRQQLFYLRREGKTHYWLFGFTGGLTHYSNGQHGCTYTGYARGTSGECESPSSSVGANRVPNVVDGDFSTTYFSEALDARWAEQTDPFGVMRWQLSAGVELKQDPLNFRPGGTNAAQAREYGQREYGNRVAAEYRHLGHMEGIVRLAADATWRYGGGVEAPLKAQSIELSYVFRRLSYTGLFVRQHFGFDYYNIHFAEKQSFASVGLMWDPGRLDHLNSPFH